MRYNRLLMLKRLDIWGQLLAAFGPLVLAAVGSRDMIAGALGAYLITGAWQLISALLTRCIPDGEKRWKTPLRGIYHIALGVIAVVALFCVGMDDTGTTTLVALLIATPFAALFYFILSAVEAGALTKLAAGASGER